MTERNWVIPPFVFTSELAPGTEAGVFQLPPDLTILDGQHRTQALHLAKEKLAADQQQEKLAALLAAHVTLQYISNHGDNDARQMFVDLNQTRKISNAELAYLDSRDPVVNVAKAVMDQVPWLQERTSTNRSTPDWRNGQIFSLSTLKTLIKALEVGNRSSMPKARRNYLSTQEGQAESKATFVAFAGWLTQYLDEFKNLTDQADLNVPDERTRHYAYELRFICLLAHAWKTSRETDDDSGTQVSTLGEVCGNMNILVPDPANDLGDGNLNLLDEKGRMLAFSKGDYNEACRMLRRMAGQNV